MASDHDKWMHAMLRPEQAKASDACLDAETMAAWSDGALTGKELAAAELHASTCSRCMAILAATERSRPVEPVSKQPWIIARPFRWLVPLTAAATAVAIWIVVPDRPVTVPTTSADTQVALGGAEKGPVQPPGGGQDQELRLQRENQSRRERSEPEVEQFAKKAESVASPAPAAAPVPPVPESVPAAPAAAPSAAPAQGRDSAADLQTAARAAPSRAFAAAESAGAANAPTQWRIVTGTSVERSADGGKTWTRTSPLPGDTFAASATIGATIRAVDDSRAVVSTSDGRVFYTIDAGKSWTRVQENQTAPF